MKKLLFVALVIAICASFFASTSPDGLDFVAEKLGFANQAREHVSPMSGYSLKFLPEGPVSTTLAGIAGILIVLGIFRLAVHLLKKNNNNLKNMSTAVFISILAVSPAFAARPLITDDYGTVDVGKYELETGYNFITPKSAGDAKTGLVVQLKKGLSPFFDLGLELPYNTSAVSGMADLVMHAKLRVKEFGEDGGMTARADVKLTNGDAVRGLGSGYLDYGVIMILSKSISELTAHLNLGYTVIGDAANSSADDTFYYGAALEKTLQNGFNLAVEYTCISCMVNYSSNLQVGARFQINDSFRLDAGYSIAANKSSNDISTFGLTSLF